MGSTSEGADVLPSDSVEPRRVNKQVLAGKCILALTSKNDPVIVAVRPRWKIGIWYTASADRCLP